MSAWTKSRKRGREVFIFLNKQEEKPNLNFKCCLALVWVIQRKSTHNKLTAEDWKWNWGHVRKLRHSFGVVRWVALEMPDLRLVRRTLMVKRESPSGIGVERAERAWSRINVFPRTHLEHFSRWLISQKLHNIGKFSLTWLALPLLNYSFFRLGCYGAWSAWALILRAQIWVLLELVNIEIWD